MDFGKLQQRKDSIIKGFVEDDLEKGKALPIGTIKKRGPNNFIKTANGWKYHSRANAASKQPNGGDSIKQKTGGIDTEMVKKKVAKSKEELQKVNEQITKQRKAISDARRLGRNPVFAKKQLDKSYRLAESIKDQIGKLEHGETAMRAVLRDNNVSAQTSQSTGIRGYRHYSNGYNFDLYSDGYLSLKGVDEKQLDKIIADAKAKGFEVSEVRKPSAVPAGGKVSGFKVAKII